MAPIVSVHPIYGWGWFSSEPDNASVPVPDDFQADVTSKSKEVNGEIFRTLAGTVVEPSHPMDGFSVSLSPRHRPWDGYVNVRLRSTSGNEVTGYGTIELASFE